MIDSFDERVRRAVALTWDPKGRPPLTHAIEAVFAIAGDDLAVRAAVQRMLAQLQRGGCSDRTALTCLHVWAKVAISLGLQHVGRELEDLAFKQVDRDGYHAVARSISRKRAERERAVEEARLELASELHHYGVDADVFGRAKHLYSIHKKLRGRSPDALAIHDLFGLRVVVADVGACYRALGVAHLSFTPLAHRFKDYIAAPKPNGYRALHTGVRMRLGQDPVEIQIRSRAMHEHAERGGASHGRYKNGFELGASDPHHWVYPLTPRGEVRRLRPGANAIDFAYAVHSDIGHGCVGAVVDGAAVALTDPLASGDVVHIVHAPRMSAAPLELGRVHTARARNRVRATLLERRAF